MSDAKDPHSSASNNKPFNKFYDHGVCISVFEKEHTAEDGEVRTFNSYALQRSYKDKKTGKTEYSNSFSGSDLLRVAAMAQAAYHAHELKEGDTRGK